MPPYAAVLLASSIAVGLARGEPFDPAYLLFLQNYEGKIPNFLVSWSLCIEEHFYLVAPLVLAPLAFAGWRRRWGAVAAMGILLPAMFRAIEYVPGPAEFGYFETATHLRFEGLYLGVLLAYLPQYAGEDFNRLNRMAPFAAGVSVLCFGLAKNGWRPDRIRHDTARSCGLLRSRVAYCGRRECARREIDAHLSTDCLYELLHLSRAPSWAACRARRDRTHCTRFRNGSFRRSESDDIGIHADGLSAHGADNSGASGSSVSASHGPSGFVAVFAWLSLETPKTPLYCQDQAWPRRGSEEIDDLARPELVQSSHTAPESAQIALKPMARATIQPFWRCWKHKALCYGRSSPGP